MIQWFLNANATIFAASLPNGSYVDKMMFTETKLNMVTVRIDRKKGIKF